MKERIKKMKPYLINILLVLGVFLITLAICHIYPFGNKVLGKSDSFSQYKPMLYNFIMSIKTGTLQAFSFNNGLGNSFLFNFMFYTVSPLNLVGLLFNDSNQMFLAVVLVKIALTVFNVTFYALKKGSSHLTAFIAAISYVFGGWFLAYYYNIMWLDTIMILPLFQYGLEELIKNKKCLVFIFSLAYLYATNFLLAFSVLIYMLIYFVIGNFFYNKDKIVEKLKKTGLFIGSIGLSILLIYFYISTLFLVKRQMGLGFSNVADADYLLATKDFLASLFYGNYDLTTVFSGNTAPNLGMNTLILLSIFYFFVNKKISLKNKVYGLIGLLLCVCCLFYKEFDYVVNMFHNVTGLTYRYAFIFNFLAVMLFIHNANNIELKDNKRLYIPIIISITILVICKDLMDFEIMVMNLCFILAYLVMIIFYDKNNIHKYMMGLLVIIQTIYALSYAIPFGVTLSDEDLTSEFNTEPIKYRLSKTDDNDYFNKNMYYNTNVTHLFSSMSYNETLTSLYNLGCQTGNNSINCHSKNELFNMLFNVKNDYYLEKIYSVDKTILDTYIDSNSTKEAFENLIYGMSGITDIYEKIEIVPQKVDDKYLYETEYNFYLIDKIGEDGSLINDVQDYKSFYGDGKPATIYVLKEEKLKEIYEYLRKNQIEYSEYSDSMMMGTINVSKDQIIFTSIPYDEAWHVYIDGKEVKTTKLLGFLLGIQVQEGHHDIKLVYKNDLVKPACISIGTFACLIIYAISKKWLKRKETITQD